MFSLFKNTQEGEEKEAAANFERKHRDVDRPSGLKSKHDLNVNM